MKENDRYSLNLAWVIDMLGLFDDLQSTYLKAPLTSLLPEVHQSAWKFPNLRRLDRFWVHWLLLLFNTSQKKVMFEWIPHPWFMLAHPEQEERLVRAMKQTGGKLYMVIGGRTYLDNCYLKYWSEDLFEYVLDADAFENQRSTYYSIVDDYVLTVSLEPDLTEEIDLLYQRVRGAGDLSDESVAELFQKKTNINMVLEKNQKKASALLEKFSVLFGDRQFVD